jgi:hypothetical protein
MANNRMSLINTATGQCILLATHLATKWRALAGIEDKCDLAFAAELAEFPAAWGSTAWRIEYETDEPGLDEELRRTVEKHATPALGETSNSTRDWFYGVLQTYAVFCKFVPDAASRDKLASAIDASLRAWSRGVEPSAAHRATIEAWVVRGDIDVIIAPALVALFEQIEVGGQPALVTGANVPLDRLDRLQRRILEIWADALRRPLPGVTEGAARAGQQMADELVRASEGRALTDDDRDSLEALALGEGPRARALRRALEVCGGQAARTS